MWPGSPAGRGQRRAGHLQEPAWPTGLETAGRSGDCAEGRRQAGGGTSPVIPWKL